MQYKESKTKIIATIGPASKSKEVLREIIKEGVDVCRINLSHETQEIHAKVIQNIRDVSIELNKHVAILADLQGPKLRVGMIENGSIQIEEGDILTFVSHECIGTKEKIFLAYKEFPKDVENGDTILIDDGKLKLTVTETNKKDTVKAKVLFGGKLSSRKGVNLPNTKISLPSLTEKDLKDAEFALDSHIDWLGLSFVRKAEDIYNLKEIIKRKKKYTGVIAKIEKPEALEEIDEIIKAADGIMIARGDMGVEIEFYRVPQIQKRIVRKCLAASKPVIIATQMMESMIENFAPSRAEANDVANAVLDGADTLMLSGETSIGNHPPQVIKSMHQIIQWTEAEHYKYNIGLPPNPESKYFIADSVCFNAVKMATQTKAKAIVTFTYSGYTAIKISSYRPNANIFAFTGHKDLIPRLSLLWGIKAIFYDKEQNIDEAIDYTASILKEKGEVDIGDLIIYVASTPLKGKGRTNMIKLSWIK